MYVLEKDHRYITYKHPDKDTPAKRGTVLETGDIRSAYLFRSKEEAALELFRLSKKAKGFRITDLECPLPPAREEPGEPGAWEEPECPELPKRKAFSSEERKAVYRKTFGRCYLCGDFVDYDDFEVEHMVPLSQGGTNDTGNLFCSCHTCNTMKGKLSHGDFVKQAGKIAARAAGAPLPGEDPGAILFPGVPAPACPGRPSGTFSTSPMPRDVSATGLSGPATPTRNIQVRRRHGD